MEDNFIGIRTPEVRHIAAILMRISLEELTLNLEPYWGWLIPTNEYQRMVVDECGDEMDEGEIFPDFLWMFVVEPFEVNLGLGSLTINVTDQHGGSNFEVAKELRDWLAKFMTIGGKSRENRQVIKVTESKKHQEVAAGKREKAGAQ